MRKAHRGRLHSSRWHTCQASTRPWQGRLPACPWLPLSFAHTSDPHSASPSTLPTSANRLHPLPFISRFSRSPFLFLHVSLWINWSTDGSCSFSHQCLFHQHLLQHSSIHLSDFLFVCYASYRFSPRILWPRNTLLSDDVTVFNISYKPVFEILLCPLKEERVILCFIFPSALNREQRTQRQALNICLTNVFLTDTLGSHRGNGNSLWPG